MSHHRSSQRRSPLWPRHVKLWGGWALGIAIVLICCCLQISSRAMPPPANLPSLSAQTDALNGRSLYEAGRFQDAVQMLSQEAQRFRTEKDELHLAATLANLSLTYQQLGDWAAARSAIAESLALLAGQSTPTALRVQAQAWDVQGQLWLAQGNGENALTAWQQAANRYQQLGDTTGLMKVQLNQAQALRSQGFFRRALALLSQVNQSLQAQPDSREKALALRSLGDTWQLVGDTSQAKAALTQSLNLAQRLQLSTEVSANFLSLGNALRLEQDLKGAIAAYEKAATLATLPLARVQAQLNQFSVLIDDQQWESVQGLLTQIPPTLDSLPTNRAGIYARINFAQALLRLNQRGSGGAFSSALPLSVLLRATLQPAIQQARAVQDQRAASYAVGTLGAVYEQTGQLQEAKQVTQTALVLAQASNTWDVAYRWQWQLGRLLRQSGDVNGAIAAYDAAIANLQLLRRDLAAINPDVQFNFRDSVEPIYRQSVELLLQSETGTPSEATLEKARERIEALQLAELDNFFREACLEGQRVLLDEVVDRNNPTTTIVYPIVLRDRDRQTVNLQVIAKIPNQSLRRYAVTNLSEREFDQTITTLQTLLAEVPNAANQRALRSQAQKVYNWLLADLDRDIQRLATNASNGQTSSAKVDTLVFVLDDVLRNVPMAMLWDGQQYLVEKYGIALSLGLQLFDPKPIAREPLKVLAAGLSEPPPGASQEFGALPNVKAEISAIANLGLPTTSLLEQAFTRSTLATSINAAPFNVVHLATHGKFSSRAEDTFILAADGPINVNDFDTLLRSRDATRAEAIQLLVLSACQTATNDNRATLGLAGFAVRAGARSTLASLRNVSDESTPLIVEAFYQELNNSKEQVTKAEALRRAQVALLKGPRRTYQAPQYWAAYVLIGNWL